MPEIAADPARTRFPRVTIHRAICRGRIEPSTKERQGAPGQVWVQHSNLAMLLLERKSDLNSPVHLDTNWKSLSLEASELIVLGRV